MKRRELAPGTLFRYVVNPTHIYWVPTKKGPHEMPFGLMVSGPNKESTDWDLEVELVDIEAARKFCAEWAAKRFGEWERRV